MTELRLEYDRKIFTTTNLNIGTWPKMLTLMNIIYLISVIFTCCQNIYLILGNLQLLMFIIVNFLIIFTKLRSCSFVHLNSVMWAFLLKTCNFLFIFQVTASYFSLNVKVLTFFVQNWDRKELTLFV